MQDALAVCGLVVCWIATVLAVLAWTVFLPVVGLLWCVGWLS